MPPTAVASTTDPVRIHYSRPPDREDIFVQRLVYRTPEVAVTFLGHTPLAGPIEVDGRVILEPGAPVVWFTFPDARHDIGRFHRADGSFTGLYANVLTPVEGFESASWHTTDLFLDVWLAPGSPPVLLDADELDAAERAGHLTTELADVARREARRLISEIGARRWPPAIVDTWTLERVRRVLASDPGPS